MSDSKAVEARYRAAQEQFAAYRVDTEAAMATLRAIPLSLHCWQGDDVGGFENSGEELSGGIAVTGNYLGKPRTADELRQDMELALSLLPGQHRLNLHACYAEVAGRRIDRNQLQPEHFATWIDWAKEQRLGLDFNPTFFSHPLAADGFTLAHSDPGIRQFWVEHGIACRTIGAAMGKALGTPTITNVWIPDGFKDTPVDRRGPRQRLAASLDEMFAAPIDETHNRDAVESKLFGIGSESYVVGSHEFYMGYAISRDKMLCLDAGHFHPTEGIADKLSSVLQYLDEVLLHVSRGVRWDSDHVVTVTDELRAIAQEIVRGEYLDRVHVGLDFFDASINRIAAWVIGSRGTLKALLAALLDPLAQLREMEVAGDYTGRLALLEESKTLPVGAVWDYYCQSLGVPVGMDWLNEVRDYESRVLANR